MNNKFQSGDLVRVAIPHSGITQSHHNRLGLVINKVPDGIEGCEEYRVLFGNSITMWYGQSLEKVESKENKE